ncbi:methylmalonyl-CoA mutase family protein [Rhodococcus sp. NPDC049939]|uniref:methylmalonyl-CoA mutase family protein n=1 Tax=Rhodococcus sp. NPDC049939 TaxID=3155511 RepID=UPI003402D249
MALASQTEEAERAYADWQRAVAGVLAKSRRIDATELGPDPQKILETVTYDGVTVAPLYSPRDEHPEHQLPGTFPYVRGASPTRDVNSGWLVSGRFGDGDTADAEDVNRSVLDSLENGVSALWLAVGAGNLPAQSLERVLDGVLLDLAPLTLDAGADAALAARALFALLDTRARTGGKGTVRTAIRVQLGAAPLTSAFSGAADVGLDDAVSLATEAESRDESVRAITVDGTAFHNSGASDAEELGASIAAGLEYLRALTTSGLTIEQALGQIGFRFSATDDQFQTIAKFRAARQVWARIAQVCGAPESGGAPQHAVTSAAMMAQRDPWVNMLRTTLAAFGAGVGGADAVTVLPFDAALPAGALDVSKTFAARIARNTQLLLLEESHLGRVLDPAAGSWYVEDLTRQVAAKAWEFFQQIEAAGGYRAALESDLIAERIASTRTQRDSDIAHRRTTVTGVNEFPNLAEAPLPAGASETGRVTRYAATFEALRDRSDAYLAANEARPKVLLVPLGPVAEHNVRTTFSTNLLASGGIEAVNPGPVSIGDGSISSAATESGAGIAVICGTDKRYADEAATAVQELRAAGVGTVLLAGSDSITTGADGAARPDGFVTARIDAVTVLSGLLDTIESSSDSSGDAGSMK